MRKSVLNTALSTAFIMALGFGVSACSGDKDEVLAIDRVDEASELARSKAPAAEEMDFPETAPMPVAAADGTAVEGAATTTDATMTDAATATAGAETAETATTDGAEASVDGAASTDAAPATDEAAAQ